MVICCGAFVSPHFALKQRKNSIRQAKKSHVALITTLCIQLIPHHHRNNTGSLELIYLFIYLLWFPFEVGVFKVRELTPLYLLKYNCTHSLSYFYDC